MTVVAVLLVLPAVIAGSFFGSRLTRRNEASLVEQIVCRLERLQSERRIHDITVAAYHEMLDATRPNRRSADDGGSR